MVTGAKLDGLTRSLAVSKHGGAVLAGAVWTERNLATEYHVSNISSAMSAVQRPPGHGPLTRYVKLRVANAPGMPGTFPRHWLQRKPLVSDPSMHHGTRVTHVSWCMSGSLTRGGRGKRPDIYGAGAIRNFTHLTRGPCVRCKRCVKKRQDRLCTNVNKFDGLTSEEGWANCQGIGKRPLWYELHDPEESVFRVWILKLRHAYHHRYIDIYVLSLLC